MKKVKSPICLRIYQEEFKALQASLQAAQESAQYWEAQCRNQNAGGPESANIENEKLKRQYITQLNLQTQTIERLQSEKDLLEEQVEEYTREKSKSQQDNLSALYSKVKELESEIQAISRADTTGSPKDKKVQQLQDEISMQARQYKRMLAEKEEEMRKTLESTRATIKQDMTIETLMKQIAELSKEKASYGQQILILKKELDSQEKYFKNEQAKIQNLYIKEAEAARSQGMQLTAMLESKTSFNAANDTQNFNTDADGLIETAKEKINILEKELKQQELYFQREILEKDKTIDLLKGKLSESFKQVNFFKKSMEDLQQQLKEVKTRFRQSEFEKKSKEMQSTQMSQKNAIQDEDSTQAKKKTDTGGKEEKKMSFQELNTVWRRFNEDDNIKSDLLMKIIQDPEVKSQCLVSMPQYLLMLYQAFSSSSPKVYENATILLYELINIKRIEESEFRALCCEHKVILSLAPQRQEETRISGS